MEKERFYHKYSSQIIIFIIYLLGALLTFTFLYIDYKEENQKQASIKFVFFQIEKKKDTIHIQRATRYNATVRQCGGDPSNTADGSKIDYDKLKKGEIKWCALSRDLVWDEYRQKLFSDTTIWRGPFEFGDTIEVYSESRRFINGKWIIHDVMSGRYRKSIDFLFDVSDMEAKFGVVEDLKIIY